MLIYNRVKNKVFYENVIKLKDISGSMYVESDSGEYYQLKVKVSHVNESNLPKVFINNIEENKKGCVVPEINIMLKDNDKVDTDLLQRNKKFFENLKRYDFSSCEKGILDLNKEKMEKDYKIEVLKIL